LSEFLIVCGAGYVSGKEVMALTLASGLVQRGSSVRVACSSWNNGDFLARLDAHGIASSQLAIGFISASLRLRNLRMTAEQAYRLPELFADYARLLERERPLAIIHTNWHHALLLWRFLRRDRDFLWLHEVIPDRLRYRLFFSSLQHRVRRFIAVSAAVAASLVRAGVSAENVTVVHNGLAPPPITGRASRRNAHVSIGIVGQVGLWKGHSDLIEAFAMLAPRLPAATLGIFGEEKGDYQDVLRARIAELSLVDRVVWKGYVKDRSAIYSTMDICVVPSRSEDPLPTVAIEAGFCALPVVATRCGGLPEIVEDGVTGILVSPQAPADLALALGDLAADATRRAEMGRNARSRMEKLFSEERFVTDFLGLMPGRG